MPRFCCKSCGIITDDPEIIPLPEKDAKFRQFAVELRQGNDAWWTLGEKVDAEFDERVAALLRRNKSALSATLQFFGLQPEPPKTQTKVELDRIYRELEWYERRLAKKYNHMIICPVCLGETTFWRDSPFPLRKGLTNLDGSPLSLSVRGLLEELETAKAGED